MSRSGMTIAELRAEKEAQAERDLDEVLRLMNQVIASVRTGPIREDLTMANVLLDSAADRLKSRDHTTPSIWSRGSR